ncbi:MAG: YafY family transcriptional regulator [Lachnospiraceae bacterium]|nr:YafY family transcriptional regulator [Lachnospiraceae bacterium]
MINRLLGMIYILMKQETVTAAELAERFEVSVRTIYRDMDTLSAAGIPIYAKKGKNGGISLTEQFVLNKMLLTQEEQQEILSGLISLRETRADGEENILQKLGEFFKTDPVDWLAIDLAAWSGRIKHLYEDIKNAILERKLIRFDYYGQHAQMSSRTVEPMQLLFKEYTWYLKAFCREKSDWRVFKLFRIKRLEILDKTFVPRERWDQEEENHSKEEQLSDNGSVPIDIWIDQKEAYRIYDRFEEDEIEVLPDGNFMVHMHASVDDWVYGVILGFGPSAEVIAPNEIRQEIRRRIRDMAERYQV